VLAAILVTVLWSSSWVLIRIGLDDEALPPLTFAGLRYGLAALVLVGWVARRARLRHQVASLGRRQVGRLALLGVVFYTITQGAQFVAIDRQPAATTSLVLSVTPLVVAAASARTLGERASRRQLVGAGLVALGAWAYFAGSLGATVVGMVAAGVGLAANAASAVMGRHVNRDATTSPVVVTAVSMAIGAGLLVVVGLAVEGMPEVSLRAGLLVAWLALVNTAAAFTLWNHAQRHLTVVESTGINNTMLVQIAFLAWIFLGEPPGVAGIVGILVVTTGVVMTQLPDRAGNPT